MTRRRWLAAVALAGVGVLGVGVTSLRGISRQTRPHQPVGAQAQVLQNAFNADFGTVRVLALVSPTCGNCLRGAADLQQHVFAAIGNRKLRGYIVWVPKLDGREANVNEATHTVEDSRASHYWDGAGYLVNAYDAVLGLHQDAWDVYLLYGPNAHWDGPTPPVPNYWMTQLSGAPGPTLNPTTLADHIRGLL